MIKFLIQFCNNQKARWIGRLLITAVFVAAILRSLDLESFSTYRVDNYRLIIFFISQYPLRWIGALRWRVALGQQGLPMSMLRALKIGSLGQLLSIIGPGQVATDALRVISGADATKEKLARSACAVVADKTIYFMTLSWLGLLSLMNSHLNSHLRALWLIFIGGVILSSIFLAILALKASKRINFCKRIPVIGHMAWISEFPAVTLRVVITLGLWAIAYQVFVGLSVFVLISAFSPSISYLDVMCIASAVTIAQIVPITIAGLGIREGALILLLEPFNIPAEASVAIGLLSFLVLNLVALTIWVSISMFELLGKRVKSSKIC